MNQSARKRSAFFLRETEMGEDAANKNMKKHKMGKPLKPSYSKDQA